MPSQEDSGAPIRIQGKCAAIVVCWLLGNGCLFSWNSMLTIEDYYAYLFPKYHPSRVLTLVYQPFALGTLSILAYNEARINTRWRNLFGYTLFFISTLLVLVLDLATSGRGGIGTYIGICAISAAFGVADAHVQGGMVGDLSFMPPELIQSFLAGLAASGALTSALRLITKAAFEDSKDSLRKGAILFFAISSLFELACVLLYAYVFPKLPIVKYYRSKAASEGSKTVSADLAAGGINKQPGENNQDPSDLERLSNKELLFQNIDYALDMFLLYALTLSIFPGFLSEDTGSHNLGGWYSLVLIAMYNVWDLIGRYVPLIKCIKLESRRGLMIAILSRSLFIPAFYFTAKYGEQGWMIMLTSVLGLSHGYLTVCVLTSAPQGYKGPEQNALGNILVLFLLGGIFAGVTLDWLWLIGKEWTFREDQQRKFRKKMVKHSKVYSNRVKKGAWSEEEDNKLRAYIQRYGHWNWRLLPKYAGLPRCGKSCRLRWVNYLKPGVKVGNYSKEVVHLIMELHDKLGNKWSAIAAELPGRTDNDIKNYWHSHVKKRSKSNVAQTGEMTEILNEEQPNLVNSRLGIREESPSDNIADAESSCLQDLENAVQPLNNPNCIARDITWDSIEGSFWTAPFLVDTSYSQNIYIEPSVIELLITSPYVQSPLHWLAEDNISSSNAFEEPKGLLWTEEKFFSP